MPDIVLKERDQDNLRRLMSLEATPGSLPPEDVLDIVDRLVPSDCVEIGLSDSAGYVLERVLLPSSTLVDDDPHVCDGPLMLGLVHQSRHRDVREVLHHVGIADGVTLGFRQGSDHVIQLSMDRYRRMFSEGDLAMLRMITPQLQRLMRTGQTPTLPASLTVTERRVLQLLATGRSNSEIAADLYVTVATVRKHLEHAYRKLGVTNRMAAAARLRGRDLPDQDVRERIDRLG